VFKGVWGRCPQQASGEENHGGILRSAGRCVLTPALLASFFSVASLLYKIGHNKVFMATRLLLLIML